MEAHALVDGPLEGRLGIGAEKLGNDAIGILSDARSLTDLDALALRTKAEFGNLDLYVNAGFSIRAPLESITEAIYDDLFNLNAKGPLFAVQKFTTLINRERSVVFTTSIANEKGVPGQAAYAYGAAKAASSSR